MSTSGGAIGPQTGVPAFNGGVDTGGTQSAGALSTAVFVSGAGRQLSVTRDVECWVPVTYNPTAGAAASCLVELSPDGVTYSTLSTETVPVGIALDGTVDSLRVTVRAGWHLRLTVTNATLGTATYY